MTIETATETSTETTREPTGPLPPTDEVPTGNVALTVVAAGKVLEIRDQEKIEDTYALRVKVLGGGCSGFQYDLYFDEPADGDTKFESQGVQMLCDMMSMMYLMGTEIDYVEGLSGAGFKFGNPNTTGSCGCGSSFSV